MTHTQKSAKPIECLEILDHYNQHKFFPVQKDVYFNIWYEWINNTQSKKINGLDQFKYRDHTNGTTQTFDNFALRNSKYRIITMLQGEFQYHKCIGKFYHFDTISTQNLLTDTNNMRALIISLPFSDTGSAHADFDKILAHCEKHKIPVCLDLAYWGIAKDIAIDLQKWKCITEVTCSLSKPFFGLETHRIGIRFSREYYDDGISMMNEINMLNLHSISLGVHFMRKYNADWNWEQYYDSYYNTIKQLCLKESNSVIFGLGDKDRFWNYNRGLPDNYRVCISEYLGDTA